MSHQQNGLHHVDGDGNTHRAFLQALLSRPTLTFETAKPLIAHIESAAHPDQPWTPEDVDQGIFEAYIARANSSLSLFDLEIRSVAHQGTDERIWALVNTTSDALTQMATLHSADEIAFVKRVIDAMFDHRPGDPEIMAVTGMRAIRMAKPRASDSGEGSSTQTQVTQAPAAAAASALTMVQAEKVLESMVAEGWFEKSNESFYSLSPRALMELRGWLIDTYNGDSPEGDDDDAHDKIKLCAACRDIVTVGQRCPDYACLARLHNRCVEKMFRARGGRQECPICGVMWQDAPAVGEQAARGQSAARRSTNGRTSRQTEAIALSDGSSEDAGDVDDSLEE